MSLKALIAIFEAVFPESNQLRACYRIFRFGVMCDLMVII
jgi:hypothetical protein